MTLDLAAAVSTGRPAFGLSYAAPPPADVLLCFAEDDSGDTVVPRLLAAGADLNRIHEVQGMRGQDGKPLPFSLGDCDVLAAKLRSLPDVRLVVIDPAGVFAGRTGLDTHKEAPVQAMLADLRDVAIAARVAMVLVAHVNKSEEAKARNQSMTGDVRPVANMTNSLLTQAGMSELAMVAANPTTPRADGCGSRPGVPAKCGSTAVQPIAAT